MSPSDLPREDRYRQRLYEIRGDPDRSLAEKLEGMLAVGCEYLGVMNGHVKRVDRSAGTHEVLVSVGDSVTVDGDLHAHGSTYCRRTIELDSPLAISEATEEGWADDPAYQKHNFECYLGATISVAGETFGTVCFVDRTPHETAFTPSERAFVELVATIVGSELDECRLDQELGDREHVIGVLNRVLRHNLRNAMTATGGFADILVENLDGDHRALAERISETAGDMTALGETARQLESVVTDPAAPSARDVGPVVEDVVAALREEFPDHEILVRTHTEQRVFATGYLSDALYELGANALDHGGDDVAVEFAVRLSGSGDNPNVEIAVSDDGPGLPEHERRILQGSPERPLDHGSGLGLCLVYWIVRRAGGNLAVEVNDGTTVSLYLAAASDATHRPTRPPYVPSELLSD